VSKNKNLIIFIAIAGIAFLVVGWVRKDNQIEKLEIANRFYINRINEQRNQLALHNLDRMRMARKNIVLFEANEVLTRRDSVSRSELKKIKHKFDALNSSELTSEMINRFENEQK